MKFEEWFKHNFPNTLGKLLQPTESEKALMDLAFNEGLKNVTAAECEGCGKLIDINYCIHCNELWAK